MTSSRIYQGGSKNDEDHSLRCHSGIRLGGRVQRIIRKSSSKRRSRLRLRQNDVSGGTTRTFASVEQLSSSQLEPSYEIATQSRLYSGNWLDELPLEVCTRIAVFARRVEISNDQSPAVLNLAEVSEKMRIAVVEAFSHELRFPVEEEHRWERLFWNGIRKLTTDCFLNKSVSRLLKSPTLRSATIPNLSAYLEAISRAPRLIALSVEFADRSPLESFNQSVRILLTSLKALNVRELHLKCVGICIFKDVFRSQEAWLELAGLCPKLSVLVIVCICSCAEVELSQFVNNLRSLRKFTFNRPVSKRTILSLQNIESVSLRHVWDGGLSMQEQCDVAVKIGKPVTGIESSFFPLCSRPSLVTEDGVASLSNCIRLSELDMHLIAGAERRFPALRELRSLRLRWENGYVDGLCSREEEYHSPDPQFFTRVVDMAPNLKTLCLFKVRISLKDIRYLLSKTASSLEVFGTSIAGQEEPAEKRIVAVINVLGKHSHSLQKLEIFGYPHLQRNEFTSEYCVYWRRRIFSVTKVLQRRSPLFDDRELILFVNKWLVLGT